MFKAIGIILILGSFISIGFSAKQMLFERVRALKSIIAALEIMLSEIYQKFTPLPTIIHELSHENIGKSSELFLYLNELLKKEDNMSFSYKWSKTINEKSEEIGLNEVDVAHLAELSSFLGRYDASEQCKYLQSTISKLNSNLNMAQTEISGKGNVYRTCAIAAGFILVLILI